MNLTHSYSFASSPRNVDDIAYTFNIPAPTSTSVARKVSHGGRRCTHKIIPWSGTAAAFVCVFFVMCFYGGIVTLHDGIRTFAILNRKLG